MRNCLALLLTVMFVLLAVAEPGATKAYQETPPTYSVARLDVPFISQIQKSCGKGYHGAANCGPASLAMVIDYFGIRPLQFPEDLDFVHQVRFDMTLVPNACGQPYIEVSAIERSLKVYGLAYERPSTLAETLEYVAQGAPSIVAVKGLKLQPPQTPAGWFYTDDDPPVHVDDHIVVLLGAGEVDGTPVVYVNDPLCYDGSAPCTAADHQGYYTRESFTLALEAHGTKPFAVTGVPGRSTPSLPQVTRTAPPLTQEQFIETAAVHAQMSQRETGVPASVTIAQAIQESEWGTKHLGDALNYFGIKAHQLSDGTVYIGPVATGWTWAKTWEEVDGKKVVVDARFRTYGSMQDSIVDHGYFFWENSRYHSAFEHQRDPREFARAIAEAGYATDSDYLAALLALMNENDLYAYDVPDDPPPGEPASGLVVDDEGTGAERQGTPKYWYEVGVGYGRHSYWTNADRKEDNSMRWAPALPFAGRYEVSVYVPPLNSTTEHARYRIVHAGREDEVEVSQRASPKRWVTLGEYDFAATGNEYIRLSDNTGEKFGTCRIAFDAIRFVQTGEAPPPWDAQAGKAAVATIVAEQAGTLSIEVRNTGLATWQPGQVVLRNVKRPFGAAASQPLQASTAPGETAVWQLSITAPKQPGVQTSIWQVEQGGERFGDRITAWVVVVPEDATDLRARIEQELDEWRRRREQDIEDLMDRIGEMISTWVQNWFERQVEKARQALGRWWLDLQEQGCASLWLALVPLLTWLLAHFGHIRR